MYNNNNNSFTFYNDNNIILPSPIKQQPMNDDEFFNKMKSNRVQQPQNELQPQIINQPTQMNDDEFFNEIRYGGNSKNQIKENLINSFVATHHKTNSNISVDELIVGNDQDIEAGDEEFIHIVSEKDTLPGLALKYNCTVEEIKQLNKLPTHSLESRYTLVIPNQQNNNNNNGNINYNGEMDQVLKKRIIDRFLKNTGCNDRNIAIEFLEKCKYDYFKSIVEFHNSKEGNSIDDFKNFNEIIKDVDSDGEDIDSFFSNLDDKNNSLPMSVINSNNTSTNNILKNSDILINQYKDIYSNSSNNTNRFNNSFFENDNFNQHNDSFIDKITKNINNCSYFDNNRSLNESQGNIEEDNSSFEEDYSNFDTNKKDAFSSFGDVFNEEFKKNYFKEQQHSQLEEQQKKLNKNTAGSVFIKSSKEQMVEETYNINYVTKNFKIEKKKGFGNNPKDKYNFRGKKQGVQCCFAFK